MKTVLHQDWSCAPDGHTVLRFKAGDTLTGRAAELALADGVGFNPVEETKPAPKLETKKGRRK